MPRGATIASGSGTSVQEVNKLVKQYQDMAKMMRRMGKMSGGNPAALAQMLGGGRVATDGNMTHLKACLEWEAAWVVV